MRRLFGGAPAVGAGVLKHVHLHDAMQARYAGTERRATCATSCGRPASPPSWSMATVRALRKLVGRLDWQPPASHWARLPRHVHATPTADRRAKERVRRRRRSARAATRSWCSTSAPTTATYSRVAADTPQYVVAVEGDHGGHRHAVPAAARRRGAAHPAAGDGPGRPLARRRLARPWSGPAFAARADADVVLALALVHHLAIGRNVPLPPGRGLARRPRPVALVVEFVGPEDPMAQRLLANKPAGMFGDYRRDEFERLLGERFTVARPGGAAVRHPDPLLRECRVADRADRLRYRDATALRPGWRFEALGVRRAVRAVRVRGGAAACWRYSARSPDFFIFHRVTGRDVAAAGRGAGADPAAGAVGARGRGGAGRPPSSPGSPRGDVGMLVVLFAIQLGKHLTRGARAAAGRGGARGGGCGHGRAYLRLQATRQVLRFAAVGPLVFAVVFAFASPASAVVLRRRRAVARRRPGRPARTRRWS